MVVPRAAGAAPSRLSAELVNSRALWQPTKYIALQSIPWFRQRVDKWAPTFQPEKENRRCKTAFEMSIVAHYATIIRLTRMPITQKPNRANL